MGLFIHKDLTLDEDKVDEGKTSLTNTKQDIKDTSTNIINQIRRINNAKGYSTYVGEIIDTSSFTEYDTACNSVVDELVKEIDSMVKSINDYNNASWIEQDFADIGMALTKFAEGIFSFGEQIIDGVATIVGFIPVNIADAINGNNDASEAFGNWIKKDHVGDFFYDQYENGIFKDMNSIADFSHTSTAASVFKMGGEIAPYIALTVVTGGAAGAGVLALETAMAGVSGVGRKTQEELQSGKQFNQAALSGFKQGAIDAAITYGAGKLAQTVGKAFKAGDKLDDAVKLADKGDDAMKLLDKGDDLLALPEKAGLSNIDDVTRIAADKVDDFEVIGERIAKSGAGEKFYKVKYADGTIDFVNAATGEAANAGKAIDPSKLKAAVGAVDDVASGSSKVARTAAENIDNAASNVTRTAAGSADDAAAAAAKKVETAKNSWQQSKTAYKQAKSLHGRSSPITKNLKTSASVAKTEYKEALKASAEATANSAGKTSKVATKLARAEGALEGTKLYRTVDNFVEKSKFTKALVDPSNTGKAINTVRVAGSLAGAGLIAKNNLNSNIAELQISKC